MADTFISYRSLRRPAVRHLAHTLESNGFSVWYDYALLSGKAFAPAIEQQLRAAKAVIVVWCPLAVASEWVREEADLAKSLGTYLPVWLEKVELPLGYRGADTIDLSGWDGDPRSHRLDRLLEQIEAKIGREALPNRRLLAEQQMQWRDHGKLGWAAMPRDEDLAARLEQERKAHGGFAAREPSPQGPESPQAVAPSAPLDPVVERAEAAPAPSPASRHWARVKDSEDLEALALFERTYPATPEADQALSRRRALRWAQLQELTDPGPWRVFISQFAGSTEAAAAAERLPHVVLAAAIAAQDPRALQSAVDVVREFASIREPSAAIAQLIDDLLAAAIRLADPRALEAAINAFPQADLAFDARLKLRQIEPWFVQMTLTGHGDYIHSAAWSPDGARLASASADATLRIWDAATGKELTQLTGHGNTVRSAAWSPDGARLASASYDKTLRIWDAATGKELAKLTGHGGYIHSAAWSPDGARLASASADKTLRIWDAATGKELAKLTGHGNAVYSAAWSPDGARLASASADATLRIWDAATGKELAKLTGHGGYIHSAAWSPDGARLASASADETLRVRDVVRGMALVKLTGHGNTVRSAAWSPDGARLASASTDTTLRIWAER